MKGWAADEVASPGGLVGMVAAGAPGAAPSVVFQLVFPLIISKLRTGMYVLLHICLRE